MAAIPKGSIVRQKVVPIEGTVDKTEFDESKNMLKYHVTYTGADKAPTARWFSEDELTLVSTPKPEGEAASTTK